MLNNIEMLKGTYTFCMKQYEKVSKQSNKNKDLYNKWIVCNIDVKIIKTEWKLEEKMIELNKIQYIL